MDWIFGERRASALARPRSTSPFDDFGAADFGEFDEVRAEFRLLDNAAVTDIKYGTNVTGQYPATLVTFTGEVVKGDKNIKPGQQTLTVAFYGTQASGAIREMNPPAVGEKGMFFLTGESQIGFRNICGGYAQGYFKNAGGKYLNALGNNGLQMQQAATKLMQTRAGMQPTGEASSKFLQANTAIKRLQAAPEGQAVPTADFRTLVQEMVSQNYSTPTNNGQQ